MTSERGALDRFEFVRAHTRVEPVPFVPELRLHQADDAFRLWQTTARDLERDGMALPYWAFAWAGGTALARYVLDHAELVRGQRVLDLATGSGLVAIAAARAGALEVIANDVDALALAATELNAALNDVSVATLHADLLSDAAVQLERVGQADVILAGDVAYERAFAEAAFAFLRARAARGETVLVGDPGRAYLPTDLEAVETYAIPTPATLESSESTRTTVYRVRR
jgi:predicted nicotinamide N-methyase